MPARNPEQQTEYHALSRSVAHRLRGRRGSLEAMPHIPFDVIIEILCHLHPRDLLSLAQTSKVFRELLMNRGNAFIWKTARTALPIALPDPHPLLSEPALVHLMFSPRCYACGRAPVHKVVWVWFKRYCTRCMPQMRCTVFDVEARMDAIGLDCVQGSDSRAIFNLVSAPNHIRATYCHAAQVKDFEMRWHGVHDTLEAHETLDALTALYADRKACAEAEAKLAAQLEEWSHDERLRRYVHDHDAREERFAGVLRRLEEAGWGPELEFWGAGMRFDKHGPARDLYTRRVAPKLTDKTWPKVHASLKSQLEAVRRRRIEDQQYMLGLINDTITKHYTSPAALAGDPHIIAMNAGPTALDIAWMPESAFLFTADASSNHENDAFCVSQLIVVWEQQMKEWLRRQVRSICPDVPEGLDPLDLAVAVFGCTRCEAPDPDEDAVAAPPLALRYPDILAHGCFRRSDRWRAQDWPPPPVTKAYQQLILNLEGGAPVPRCALVPERISAASARRSHDSLVEANRDPNVTKFEEVRTWAQGDGLLVPLSGMLDVLSLPESNLSWSNDDNDLFANQWVDGTM